MDAPIAKELQHLREKCPELDSASHRKVFKILSELRPGTSAHHARLAYGYYRAYPMNTKPVKRDGPNYLRLTAARLVARFPGVVLRLLDGTPLAADERTMLIDETGVSRNSLYRAIKEVEAHMATRPGVSTYICVRDLHLWAVKRGLYCEPVKADDEALQISVLKLHNLYPWTDPNLKAMT
jgi:hypothetical protein